MSIAKRKATTFTIETDLLAYVQQTRGKQSASERLNRLLKRAMLAERYDQLEREAAAFFAKESTAERKENDAFQKASMRSLEAD